MASLDQLLEVALMITRNIAGAQEVEGHRGQESWHQVGNLRVRSSNPGGSRQPLAPGCRKKSNKNITSLIVYLQ